MSFPIDGHIRDITDYIFIGVFKGVAIRHIKSIK